MKLTVAALALLVAGASYADMAAATACWHLPTGVGEDNQEKKDCETFAKQRGLECKLVPDPMNQGHDLGLAYCAVPKSLSASTAPPAPPVPPTHSVKVDKLPLYKATHNQFGFGSCQYKTKHGINHSAKCTGVDKHEGGLEITVQYQAKNLDKPEKLEEEVKFHGKAKSDGGHGGQEQPLEVHAGGKIKMKGDSIKGEGKEKVVPNDGGSEQEVTYRCTGNKDSVHCEWSA